MSNFSFSLDEIELSNNAFEDVPEGIYKVVITDAAHVNDEKNVRFEFTFTHSDGKYRNRKHWARLAYQPGPLTRQAVLDAQRKSLADLMFTLDVKGWSSEEDAKQVCHQIIGSEIYIKIKNTKSKTDGKTYSNVVDFWKLDGSNRSNKKLELDSATDVPFA